MFGSLGLPEILLIFVVALIVFGPRRLPEIGKTLGRALGEFRKATDDLKNSIEKEVRVEELRKLTSPITVPPAETVSRGEPFPSPTPEQIANDPLIDPVPEPEAAPAADPAGEPRPGTPAATE